MYGLLWSFFLFYAAILQDVETAFSTAMLYSQDLLQKNIELRLLNRDWKPEGPSAKSDQVMEEYQWSVGQASKAFRLSKWKYESAPVKEAEKLFNSGNYDKALDTIFIIHPMLADADVFFVKNAITALAMRNLHKKYNILAVNMPWNNPQMIISVWETMFGKHTYFEPIALAVSEALVLGVDGGHLTPEQINLVGWSYSGQLSGYVARYVSSKYGSKVASIMALDPYASALNNQLIHLSADDAQVVHIYHTNSFLTGTRERMGTADFVFNDGHIQPECEWPEVLQNSIKESMICSHMKVVLRFWYVILYPSKFVGRKCSSWNRLTNCLCEDHPMDNLSYPIRPDSKAQGIYHLRTLSTKPYGVGKWGVTCSSAKLLSKELENKGPNPGN